MSDCKHGNLWCNGTVKFSTTGPCLQCLRELFKERDEAREAASWLHENTKDVVCTDFVREAVERWPWLKEDDE